MIRAIDRFRDAGLELPSLDIVFAETQEELEYPFDLTIAAD